MSDTSDHLIPQEFYCATSGGGCGGFITIQVNMHLNHVVQVVCPKCGHKHQRRIKNGVLTDDGRHVSNPTEEMYPQLPAWSKTARHPESEKRSHSWENERKAVVLRPFMDDLWFERHGQI